MCFHIGPTAPIETEQSCSCGVTIPAGDRAGTLHGVPACLVCVAHETEREFARFARAYTKLVERGVTASPRTSTAGRSWAMRV